MNKKWLYLIILFICLSLAGIIGVQYLWIRNAFHIREAQFNQEANEALNNVITRLETTENLALVQQKLVTDSIMALIRSYTTDSLVPEQLEIDLDQIKDIIRGKGTHYVAYEPDIEVTSQVSYTDPLLLTSGYQMSFYWDIQEYHKIDSIMKSLNAKMREESVEVERQRTRRVIQPSRSEIIVVDPRYPSTYSPDYQEWSAKKDYWRKKEKSTLKGSISGGAIVHTDYSQEEASKIIEDQIRKLNKRTQILEDLINRMALEYEEIPPNIEARVDKEKLESILESSLADNNIHIPFEFAVYNPQNDSNALPIRSKGFSPTCIPTAHRVSLFPNDVIEKPEQLMVFFPNEQSHILQSLSFLLLGSLLFTLIIISSSGLSIFVMIRQKKISDIKTDFINNMTHEFKTPIATISIAADSIVNPKVIETPVQIRDYIRIIKEENSRMNTSVEQVLQMSFLDSREFGLSKEPQDMHHLINQSVDHFRLIVEKRNGILETQFNALASFVLGDESHLRNVIMNLLDNANKYSLEHPDITILTENRSDRFILSVTDKGIGMTQEIQKKIFEKFYRVTTGNVHNIKGFGLGLSYIKAIVLAHHGEINVTSEPGKGSRFDISFPLYKTHYDVTT